MTNDELIQFLNKYTDDEIFYKKYYEAQKNNHDYKKSIYNKDIDSLKTHNNLLAKHSKLPFFTLEDVLNSSNIDIGIMKHHRYTPVSTHTHAFFEMVYVHSGTCIQKINGSEIVFSAGDICIVPPNEKHSISVFNDSIIINVLIRKNTLSEIFLELLKGANVLSDFFPEILYEHSHKNYLIFHTKKDSFLDTLILSMYNEFIVDKQYSHTIIKNLLKAFLGFLLQNYGNDIEMHISNTNNSDIIPQILIYIEDNYNHVTLEDLCERFHFSTAYLSRTIKKSTGLNFTEIIKNIKLKKACDLLKTTDMNIKNLSEYLGYSSQEHFIRTFKKEFHMTPTEYRKK